MYKTWKSANWQEIGLHHIVMGIVMCTLISALITVGVPQAKAVEQNTDLGVTARQLQLEGARLQLQGKLEEAVKKYRESIALQPDPRLDSLIKQLEPKINKKEEGTPTAPVASNPQPSVPGEQPASTASQPAQSAAPVLATPSSVEEKTAAHTSSTTVPGGQSEAPNSQAFPVQPKNSSKSLVLTEQPSATDPNIIDFYKEKLKDEIPSYYEILEYNIEAIVKKGDLVNPIWISRFNAKIKTKEILYDKGVSEDVQIINFDKKPTYFKFVNVKTDKNTIFDLYGTSKTILSKGGYKNNFELENRDEIYDNGYSINNKYIFNDDHVIARGSEEEKELFKKIEYYKNINFVNLQGIKNNIIGLWSDKQNFYFYLKFYHNNIAHAIQRNSKPDEYNFDILYEYKIDNDIITFKMIKCKYKSNNNWHDESLQMNCQNKIFESNELYEIYYVDKDRITFTRNGFVSKQLIRIDDENVFNRYNDFEITDESGVVQHVESVKAK